MHFLSHNDSNRSTCYSIPTNDVSFSIPEWKHQEIKSISHDFEREIYQAVPLSLTDFDSLQEVEFLTKPEKPPNDSYAYQRTLIYSQDFCILVFIICFEQVLLAGQGELEKFKERVSSLKLTECEDVPSRMQKNYQERVLKKMLFQYINKGSYNVSLLEILLRKNHLLKFALSLVSKAVLRKRGLAHSYNDTVPCYVQMKVCGDYFGVLGCIKVRETTIESENFVINTCDPRCIRVFRKQNVIKQKSEVSLRRQKLERAQTPVVRRKVSKSKEKQQSRNVSPYRLSQMSTKSRNSSKVNKNSRLSKESEKGGKRSSSLMNIIKKFICS